MVPGHDTADQPDGRGRKQPWAHAGMTAARATRDGDGGGGVTTRQATLGPDTGTRTGDAVSSQTRCGRGKRPRGEHLYPTRPQRRTYQHPRDEPPEHRRQRITGDAPCARAPRHERNQRANRATETPIE